MPHNPRLTKALRWSLLPLISLAVLAASGPSEKYFAIAKNLDIFTTLYKEVNTFYVDEVDPGTVMKKGIDEMLSSLDPYTVYIPEDEIEDYRTITTGQYGGIGANIGKRAGRSTVLMPYEGWPAQKAGLLIGDEILEIDGIDLGKRQSQDISKLLKGQAGTKVKLKVKRFGAAQPLTLEVTRERIRIENVPYSGMVAGSTTGYIQLTDFTQDAARDVKKAMLDLKEKGATSIVLDLRDNPGGLLHEANNICNLFLPKDLEIVNTKSKVQDWNKVYRSLSAPVDTGIHVAVLVSDHSASASEIVGGVLQDYDRAVLVGQRTFGKGLVQTTRPLSYNSQLKITTAKYYIPSGRCIQAIDYSHRGDDGSPNRVADSLRVAFKTRAGRTVYDGGGISPDVEIKQEPLTPISASLVSKGIIFDYATEYRAKNASLPNGKAWRMGDQDFADFSTWLKPKEYDYTTKVETSLSELEDYAKKENYFDAIKTEVESLRKRMSHDKDKDLVKNKPEIMVLLEQEILSRYYFEKGYKEASFIHDPELKEALKILNDKTRYRTILAKH